MPKRQILDSSKLKAFEDDNFQFDENGGKFSKRVENTVGRGKISPLTTVFAKDMNCKQEQEDHDGPISLTCVLSSEGQQSHVPTCDPRGGASFEPRGIK